MCFSDLPANCPGKYTLMDEVHPPEGHALRDALGYTLMDEVRPKGMHYGIPWVHIKRLKKHSR
jgi:hypothetical protein